MTFVRAKVRLCAREQSSGNPYNFSTGSVSDGILFTDLMKLLYISQSMFLKDFQLNPKLCFSRFRLFTLKLKAKNVTLPRGGAITPNSIAIY